MATSNTVEFILTKPMKQIILSSPIGPRFIKISTCMLPGQDPKGEKKPCQDNFQVLSIYGTLFCFLFDGHGTDGHLVSEFCVNFVEKFIVSKHDFFMNSPKEAVIQAMEECEKALVTSSIDCNLSGSTGILLFIQDNNIHSACIGDSRAILGTLTDTMFPFNKPSNPYARGYSVNRMLKPIPLTIDQKPDNTEENLRIRKSGGIIEKFKDSFSPNGHSRVCLPEAAGGSALCMTRSFGDVLAKQFGVISTPDYRYFSMYSSYDQYIVLASDGIWDVMDNIEVLNFIEMWRDRCSDFESDQYPATYKNCTLARMLAEECRYRWLHHLQNDGVIIDDISVIVLDFAKVNESLYGSMVEGEHLKRYSKAFKHLD